MILIKSLTSLAVLWHLFAFAAGGVYAFLSCRALFRGGYDWRWSRVMRSADWQLWVSGLLVLGLEARLVGLVPCLSNPKLIAKLVVIGVWFASTQALRHLHAPAHGQRHRAAFLTACAVTAACWIYGAFLGVAKPLANGVVPLLGFLAGFAGLIALSIGIILVLEHRMTPAASGPG